MSEFKGFPKISRLNSPVLITEKIDGTNACVVIQDGVVSAQSRNRIITPDNDNYGFAGWVQTNQDLLKELLGEGYHFGEWFGKSIARNYNLPDRYFALFQIYRYEHITEPIPLIDGWICLVPELLRAIEFTPDVLSIAKAILSQGSKINEFNRPEGFVVFFEHNRTLFKVILDKDNPTKPKAPKKEGNKKPQWTPEMIEAARKKAMEAKCNEI